MQRAYRLVSYGWRQPCRLGGMSSNLRLIDISVPNTRAKRINPAARMNVSVREPLYQPGTHSALVEGCGWSWNKLCSIIKLALFPSEISSCVFAGKECSQRLLDTCNRFLWQFCVVLSGAIFSSTPFQLRDIVGQSRQVAGVVEHRCIFQDSKYACFSLYSFQFTRHRLKEAVSPARAGHQLRYAEIFRHANIYYQLIWT